MKTTIAFILIIQVITSFPVYSENRISRGINSVLNSLPNFSQFPIVLNRTINAGFEEWERLQVLMKDRATNDIALFQKTIQNLGNDINTMANSFSLTNYKAYVDLYTNYRLEIAKIILQVLNDVYVLITIEVPKSLNRILTAARKQGLLLLL